MNLSLITELTDKYISKSQKARIFTESWVLREIFCPKCGGSVNNHINNKPVADFYCIKCIEDFELKSKKGKILNKVPAGAYNQMIQRINSKNKPNFFFLGYLESLRVNDFFVVPKHFFTKKMIEMRKPLSLSARRAGWIGSNILFSKIPKAGQIYYIENGIVVSKNDVLSKWNKTAFLRQIKKEETKGWILDIMNCIDALKIKKFSLEDVYTFEKDLKEIHPKNKHIKPKIRQQLQFLRNKGYLEFIGNGVYKLK